MRDWQLLRAADSLNWTPAKHPRKPWRTKSCVHPFIAIECRGVTTDDARLTTIFIQSILVKQHMLSPEAESAPGLEAVHIYIAGPLNPSEPS